MKIRSHLLTVPPAFPATAHAYFRSKLAFEADCSDVWADLQAGVGGFTLVDCRNADQYAQGHILGAVSLPHRQINLASIAALPADHVFITYCNGPHCNASPKGAMRLTELGRRAKEMPGGLVGWRAEGFPLNEGAGASLPRRGSDHDSLS
jgi:rhodanese-related sulfurtransferase